MAARDFANLEVVFRVKKTYKVVQDPDTALFGIQDDQGEVVFPCIYYEIDFKNVYDGIYVRAAKPESLWGVLRLDTANEIIPVEYDFVSQIFDGARVLVSKTQNGIEIRDWTYLARE